MACNLSIEIARSLFSSWTKLETTVGKEGRYKPHNGEKYSDFVQIGGISYGRNPDYQRSDALIKKCARPLGQKKKATTHAVCYVYLAALDGVLRRESTNALAVLCAVEEKRAAQAIMIDLEVQEIATCMLLEAYFLSAHLRQETGDKRKPRGQGKSYE